MELPYTFLTHSLYNFIHVHWVSYEKNIERSAYLSLPFSTDSMRYRDRERETYGENPRDVHTTAVLWLFHISSHTVPQIPL